MDLCRLSLAKAALGHERRATAPWRDWPHGCVAAIGGPDRRALGSEASSRVCPLVSKSPPVFRLPTDVIVLGVRWYLRTDCRTATSRTSLTERGIDVDHVSVYTAGGSGAGPEPT
jgi:hypothetical protein